MSMLAEKKRKQKWSLNPRGNDWVQDTNKFGQKMLEKMGWQTGKGLGAKEDGIKEHIKVSYKNDSRGMGFKDSNDQWTEHETNFSALLESLSGEKPDEIKLNSLEKKSQSSRARVHYHKFTRGKDLSRYSEKDLANIFGKKSLKDSKKTEVVEKKEIADEQTEKESKYLLNAGSMRDYFKKKLPSLGQSNGYVVGHNGVLKKENTDTESDLRPSFSLNSSEKDDETVSYVGFGFNSDKNPETEPERNGKVTFVSYVNGNCVEENKSKKKRKAAEKDVDNAQFPKKKAKNNRDATSDSDNRGISNPGFNPLQTPVKVEKHILDTIAESNSEDSSESQDDCSTFGVTMAQVHVSPQNKKKSKGVDNVTFVERDVAELNGDKENTGASFEVKTVKRKKKSLQESSDSYKVQHQKPNIEEIETLDAIDLTVGSEEVEECLNGAIPRQVQVKKSKKKKKGEISIDLTTEDSPEVSVIEEVPPRLKEKKKKKANNLALENPCFDSLEDSIEVTQVEENPYEVKIKKKKKKTKDGIDNVNFNESVADETSVAPNEENPYEVKVTLKKKKKKKDDNYAIENPNFNESLEEVVCTEIEENPYEVKPKKKKTKKNNELALDNPTFNPNDTVIEGKKKKKSKKRPETLAPTLVNSSSDIIEDVSFNIEESDLMLNVVTTPITTRPERVNGDSDYSITRINSVKRRKSVRFSDVTEERIIPNNDELRNLSDAENRNELFEINTHVINSNVEEQNVSFDMSVTYEENKKRGKKRKLGVDNGAFDKQKTNLEENVDAISKTIDRYQAEIENDINEKKLESLTMEDIMIGEVGNPHGEHEKLPDGTKLKFKYSNFVSHTPFYHLDKTGAKKAYKHLIKGDIVVGFKNTNLHKIEGYAIRKKSMAV